MNIDKKRGFLAILVIISLASSTLAEIFEDNSEEDFSKGAYEKTFYEDAVKLIKGENTGTYTSRVFDAGSKASWQDLSWKSDSGSILVLVDVGEAIYKSTNQGVDWIVVDESFNNANTDAVSLVSKSDGTLYIVDLGENIWKSTAFGYEWTKVNDDYNGEESSNAVVMTLDSNKLYIFEDDEDVWVSEDEGITWTKMNDDFDGSDETSNARGVTVVNEKLFVVAGNSDVYVSEDQGITFTEINDNYNGGNGADGLAHDLNNNLYIVHNQKIWKSENEGVAWTEVNGDFNGDQDGSAGKTITSDSNNHLYVVDASEDVYRSIDNGVNWDNLADDRFNGDVKSAASYVQPVVKLQARSDKDNLDWGEFTGPDGTSESYYTIKDLENLNVTNNRYFQYIVYFDSQDPDYSPTFYNLKINYFDLPPAWSAEGVVTGTVTEYSPETKGVLKIKWDDDKIDTVLIESDYSGTAVNYTAVEKDGEYVHEAVMPAGTHYWKSHANDSSGHWSETEAFAFTIEKSDSELIFTINNIGGNIKINTGTKVDFKAELSTPEDGVLTLYENGVELASEQKTLTHDKTYNEDGEYKIKIHYEGDENYNEASIEYKIIVETPPAPSSGGGGGSGGSSGGGSSSSSGGSGSVGNAGFSSGYRISRNRESSEETAESVSTVVETSDSSSGIITETEEIVEVNLQQSEKNPAETPEENEEDSTSPLTGSVVGVGEEKSSSKGLIATLIAVFLLAATSLGIYLHRKGKIPPLKNFSFKEKIAEFKHRREFARKLDEGEIE